MDECFTLPNGYKFGFDGIIGLIPGFGDLVSSGVSSVIVYQAIQRKVPFYILLAMIANIIIDTAVGAIPVLGDVFDFFWKSNKKNLYLLEHYSTDRKSVNKQSAASLMLLAAIIVLTLSLMIAVIYLVVAILGKLF